METMKVFKVSGGQFNQMEILLRQMMMHVIATKARII